MYNRVRSSGGGWSTAKILGTILSLTAVVAVVIIVCIATSTKEELIMVMEVSRHGAREPTKLFNFTKDPDNGNFNSTSSLLPFGKK